ncbi:MAG: toxin, partial [Gammaproteobacteria bacterium]|nr:toxin [Gammaproteobacteria bacterium]
FTDDASTTNIDKTSHVPPVLTRTWFHTGVYLGRDHISNFFAGLLDEHDTGEYYREPGLTDAQARTLLLPDTVLPDGLTVEEEREACRALKGAMLRQEVYALDGTPKAKHPYTVTEQNFTIKQLQPRKGNRHSVFFTHAREAINYHYERNSEDPRVSHALTLEVDGYGNVLKSAAIAYGRRKDSTDAELSPEERKKQRLIHMTCTENRFTRPYNTAINPSNRIGSVAIDEDDAYRAPLPAETRTYELRKAQQEQSAEGRTELFHFDDVLAKVIQAGDGKHDVSYEDLEFNRAKEIIANDPGQREKYFRRLIEHVRMRYRKNDLSAMLPFGQFQSLALPGESYTLAFTPGLLDVYKSKITS